MRQIPFVRSVLPVLLCLAASAEAQNLVVNGSFEVGGTGPGTIALTSVVPGWQIDNGGHLVPLQGGQAADGTTLLILGLRAAPAEIFQDVPTLPGAQYRIRFFHTPQPGEDDNRLEVRWGGAVLTNLALDGSSLTAPNWQSHTFTRPGTGTSTRLTFADQSVLGDVRGSWIDAVFVQSVTPLLAATKTVSHPVVPPGGTFTFTLVIRNLGIETQPDNPTDEMVDVLPAGLTLVGATASFGTATADVATRTVRWNGALPGNGGQATVTVTATAASLPEGTVLTNQAEVRFDADANGTNESTALSDDPTTLAAGDPTEIEIRSLVILVPTLSTWGLMLLAAGLAGMSLRRLRQRAGAGER